MYVIETNQDYLSWFSSGAKKPPRFLQTTAAFRYFFATFPPVALPQLRPRLVTTCWR